MGTKAQHAIMYRVLPQFLRQMREKAGLTQRQIGKRLGKSHSYIYNCETGNRRVDVTEFMAWAKACDVNPKTAFANLLNLLR